MHPRCATFYSISSTLYYCCYQNSRVLLTIWWPTHPKIIQTTSIALSTYKQNTTSKVFPNLAVAPIAAATLNNYFILLFTILNTAQVFILVNHSHKYCIIQKTDKLSLCQHTCYSVVSSEYLRSYTNVASWSTDTYINLYLELLTLLCLQYYTMLHTEWYQDMFL